jgi:hypothetical protein
VANGAWALGDFEYNGLIDDDDVTLLGAFYNPSGGPPVTPVGSGVSDEWWSGDRRGGEAVSGEWTIVASQLVALTSGPEDRHAIAPAVRPGIRIEQNMLRSEGPTQDRAVSAGPSDLSIREFVQIPGPYGPGYSMPALRAFDNQTTRMQTRVAGPEDDDEIAHNDALIDLLAATIATSGESLADSRLSTAQRTVISDAIWANKFLD